MSDHDDLAAALSPEDAKLVTLARATRARARADEGAAVRDLDGRTYAAASVRLEHLHLSALEACVAMAVASAAAGLEAAVVLTDGDVPDTRAVADLAGRACRCSSATPRGASTRARSPRADR